MGSVPLPVRPCVNSFGDVLYPLNVLHVMVRVLNVTLSSFSPETLVIRRVRRGSRHSTRYTEDDASVVASEKSHVGGLDVTAGTEPTSARSHRHRHSAVESSRTPRSRRSRSAEELSFSMESKMTEGAVRRSRSDDARLSTGRRMDAKEAARRPNGSDAATAAAPVTPMPGKPPLSGRRTISGDPLNRSGGAPSLEPPTPVRESSHGTHRTSRSGREHRSRSSGGRSSVPRERDGRPSRSVDGFSRHSSSARNPRDKVPVTGKRTKRRTVRQYLSTLNVTKQAYLLAHILRAIPVSLLHYSCGLKRQFAALPMLHFADLSTRGKQLLGPFVVHTQSSPLLYNPAEQRLLSSSHVIPFLMLRTVLQALARFIEDKLFMDASLVARSLRSRKSSRTLTGWVMRLFSHTIVDPFFLGIVSPLLCVLVNDFSTPTGPLRCTFTGLLRGFVMGGVSVIVHHLVIPFFSQLANRAVVTVFETAEYVVLRRYASPLPVETDSSSNSDSDEDDDVASVVKGASSSVDTHSRTKAVTSQPPGSTSGVPEVSTTLTPKDANLASETVTREKRRQLKERKERGRQRALRRQERDASIHQTILRAIVYRVVGSLMAEVLVEHPLGVLVELLRGRSMLHAVGLLAVYDGAPAGPLSWATALSWCSQQCQLLSLSQDTLPTVVEAIRRMGADAGEEVVKLTSSIQVASGQSAAIDAITSRVRETVFSGGHPSVDESAELLHYTILSAAPLYYGVQFTVLDKLLGFYMAVWTRLTK